jgi:hypothetical protein
MLNFNRNSVHVGPANRGGRYLDPPQEQKLSWMGPTSFILFIERLGVSKMGINDVEIVGIDE